KKRLSRQRAKRHRGFSQKKPLGLSVTSRPQRGQVPTTGRLEGKRYSASSTGAKSETSPVTISCTSERNTSGSSSPSSIFWSDHSHWAVSWGERRGAGRMAAKALPLWAEINVAACPSLPLTRWTKRSEERRVGKERE